MKLVDSEEFLNYLENIILDNLDKAGHSNVIKLLGIVVSSPNFSVERKQQLYKSLEEHFLKFIIVYSASETISVALNFFKSGYSSKLFMRLVLDRLADLIHEMKNEQLKQALYVAGVVKDDLRERRRLVRNIQDHVGLIVITRFF